MKILHINTTDGGGAAKACIRIHMGLLRKGYDSKLLTLFKYTDYVPQHYSFDPKQNYLQKIYKGLRFRAMSRYQESMLHNRPATSSLFSFPNTVYDITASRHYQDATLVHLHWVSNFLDYGSFFRNNKKPVIWTPHDMNPFTGGCHSALDCHKFTEDCSCCPQLEGTLDPKVSASILQKKKAALASQQALTLVSLSRFMQRSMQSSAACKQLPNAIIPNAVDTDVFKCMEKEEAKRRLGLPLDKKVLFFVSDDILNPLKGLSILLESFQYLQEREDIFLLTAGKAANAMAGVRFPHRHIGYVQNDADLSVVYNAADVLINPSLAESFSLISIEAMACCTPVVAFAVGGIPDMVRNGETGLLAQTRDARDLALKIQWLLDHEEERKRMGLRGRRVTEEEYGSDRQIDRYVSLYRAAAEKIQ